MVDGQNLKHEDGSQVQGIFIQREPCVEVEANAEEVNDCNDDSLGHHHKPTLSPTSEGSEEDGLEIVVASLDVVDSVETKATEDSIDADTAFIGATVTATDMKTSSSEEPFKAPQSCTTIRSRSTSAIVVISSLFFTFILYPRFGGNSLLFDFACFASLTFFYAIGSFGGIEFWLWFRRFRKAHSS